MSISKSGAHRLDISSTMRQSQNGDEGLPSPLDMARAAADAYGSGTPPPGQMRGDVAPEDDEAPPPPYRNESPTAAGPVRHREGEGSNPKLVPPMPTQTTGASSGSAISSHSSQDAARSSLESSSLASNLGTETNQAAAPSYVERESQGVPIAPGTENTEVHVVDDGRIEMHIKESHLVSSIIAQTMDAQTTNSSSLPAKNGQEPIEKLTRLNIVMQVIGSRGDVQPFVALGQTLKRQGHRVRLATHPYFQKFVEENGLEFFSIGGDPAQLMAFMVKNPRLVPSMGAVARGEIAKRQKEMHEILIGCWRSCYEAGDGLGPSLSDNFNRRDEQEGEPFLAHAIIANPPSLAHVHCAEKLGIPLHIIFTMPWSPTVAFPHPLASIASSSTDERRTNFLSYALVEALTWQGLGRTINRFREKTLFLDPLGDLSGPAINTRLRVPHTYCWSPALIPKPRDWDKHISISGFCFLDHPTGYLPDPDLAAFLEAGPPPVYIGFGSIIVDDPDGLTKKLFTAIERTGVRALVSKGWGGLGTDSLAIPDNIFMLGNVPHDWLFQKVSCVVHHGGAGTTSAGIAAGKPTVVVPFFGDQHFWGSMVAKAGAGPAPIPYKKLTADNLADAITMALGPETVEGAKKLGASMATEKGSETATDEFHRSLGFNQLRCDLAPGHTAVWRIKKSDIKLSAFAAKVLSEEGILDMNELKLYRPREYPTDQGSLDPISGGFGAILGAVGNLMLGSINIPIDIAKAVVDKSPEALQPQRKDSTLKSSTSSTPQRQDSARASSISKTSLPIASSSRQGTLLESAVNRVPSQASRRPDSKQQEVLEDGGRELLHPAVRESCAPPADSDHDSLYTVTHPDNATDVTDGTASEGFSQPQHAKQGTRAKAKVMRKITAGKAFGFGFLKELTGSESVARSKFLQDTTGSVENHPEGSIGSDAALGAGKSLGRIASISMKVPVEFAMGITSGFNNVPKMYGDTTVRPTQKVAGFSSGLQAATKGLGYGVYDGITGLVTQPVRGAKEEGVAGFIKGFGKGVGGSLLKPGAAIFGIAGYTLKGSLQELQNHFDHGLQSHMIAVRRAEGTEAWRRASVEERAAVVRAWRSGTAAEKASERARAKTGMLDRWQSVQRSRKEWKQAAARQRLQEEEEEGQQEEEEEEKEGRWAHHPPPSP